MADPAAANAPHFVTVVLQVEKPWADHELLAEAVADDLRDAGWLPLGISVYDVPRTGRIIHGDAE